MVLLTANQVAHRLMIAYNPAKEQYKAILGRVVARDTAVLASLEYHGTHPGWHVHGACGEIGPLCYGRTHHPEMTRIPNGGAPHRRMTFAMDDERALEVAASFYRIDGLRPQDDQLGLFK